MIEESASSDGGPAPERPPSDASSPPPPSIFTFPNRIAFGAGSLQALPDELRRLKVARPMVVTDPGLAGTGLADAVLALLESPVLFSDVQANPTEADVQGGAERFREAGCDGLIGFGGGSPIDAAKAIRLILAHPGPIADYDVTTGGMDRIKPDMVPMAAVPTTAGTGSEAGRGALIQIPGTGRKTAVLSPHLLPNVAVCDPELTLGLPPALTAGTGMDALTHCLESYLSTTYHPICDGIAVEGLRFLFRGLETAVRDGADREARTATMMGALLGGISFHKGLGVVHALSHALGGEGRVHHGTLNAVLLAHSLRFNREAAEPRMAELAGRIGLGRAGDGPGHLITLVELIMARMPLPRRLGQVDGLARDRISDYARLAMLDHCRLTNPRPCTQADLEELLDRAW